MASVGVRRNAAWLTLFAGFLSVLALVCTTLRPPSDADLVLQFTRDSANYQRVITMLTADTNIGTIDPGFLWHVEKPFHDASAAQVGIPEMRLAEYRRILGALGVIRLDRWARDQVMFATWARGFGGNTHHRGIAWLYVPASSIGWRRFQVIAAPWYIRGLGSGGEAA